MFLKIESNVMNGLESASVRNEELDILHIGSIFTIILHARHTIDTCNHWNDMRFLWTLQNNFFTLFQCKNEWILRSYPVFFLYFSRVLLYMDITCGEILTVTI